MLWPSEPLHFFYAVADYSYYLWLSGEKIFYCYLLVFSDYGFDADAEDGEVGAEVAEVECLVVGDGFVEADGELEGSGVVYDVEDALTIRDVNAIHLLGVRPCVYTDIGEKELRGGSVFEFRISCFPWGSFTEVNDAVVSYLYFPVIEEAVPTTAFGHVLAVAVLVLAVATGADGVAEDDGF